MKSVDKKRKICVVTGTRAEYGLLYWLMKEIQNDSDLELQLIVTGMHLSPEFGLTYKEIEKDGFIIDKKIEILLSSDTPIGISKSMGLGLISFAEAYEELKPDIIVILGDRSEMFTAAGAALISRLPIAHLHGGEISEGVYDDAIRHCITKMSHLHFVAAEEYKKRVIQLGESPNSVFNVGALGIDNINKLKLMSKDKFEKSIQFNLNKKNIIVTFHPVTLERDTSGEQFQELLYALDELHETNIIFTKANADTGGRIINGMIDDFVLINSDKSTEFDSMGQLKYLSAIKHVDLIIGNSSSGLIEAPIFKKPTINIGERQKGRIKAESVIDCNPTKDSIFKAIELAYSTEFQDTLKILKNPYGEGDASKIIKKEIKKTDLNNIIKKTFYDL